jgi:hypothetical protein
MWATYHMLARDIDAPRRSWYAVLVSHSSGRDHVIERTVQWPATRARYPG